MAAVFYAGASELVTLTNTFTVANVGPTDPTTVTLTITPPSGVPVSYTYGAAQITKDSTGVYHKDLDISAEAGTWQYEWIGTGTASDHQVGTWEVLPTALGHLYATVEALKSRLSGIATTDTIDDFELHSACFAASRYVEQKCQRTFWHGAAGEVRTFEPTTYYNLKLPVWSELISVATLKTDPGGDGIYEITWASTDYQLRPVNASAGPEARPYTEIRTVGNQIFPLLVWPRLRTDLIQVTGVWGWPTVPWAIRQATLLVAAELFKLKDAPFGVAGFGDFGVVRVKDNPVVEGLLAPYCRYSTFVG